MFYWTVLKTWLWVYLHHCGAPRSASLSGGFKKRRNKTSDTLSVPNSQIWVGMRGGAKKVVRNWINSTVSPNQRKFFVENYEEIQAELNLGDSEKENEDSRKDKTPLLHLCREMPSPWSKGWKLGILVKKEHNWGFWGWKRKTFTKGDWELLPWICHECALSPWRCTFTPKYVFDTRYSPTY